MPPASEELSRHFARTARGRSLVIGLTGPNAAGKGEAAAYLERRGLARHSLSDVVREEAGRRGMTHGRDDLIAVGNALRAAGGPGVLAERIVPRLGRWDVVDSIRSPHEVRVLRRVPGFLLVAVSAPIGLRFARSRARGRLGDGETLADFQRREEEENSTDPLRQQLGATLALADFTIENSGTIAELEEKLARLVDKLES